MTRIWTFSPLVLMGAIIVAVVLFSPEADTPPTTKADTTGTEASLTDEAIETDNATTKVTIGEEVAILADDEDMAVATLSRLAETMKLAEEKGLSKAIWLGQLSSNDLVPESMRLDKSLTDFGFTRGTDGRLRLGGYVFTAYLRDTDGEHVEEPTTLTGYLRVANINMTRSACVVAQPITKDGKRRSFFLSNDGTKRSAIVLGNVTADDAHDWPILRQ